MPRRRRVDLAVVNGSIHGYEIKSERDTLARLPGQISVYDTALDFVTIIAAPAHAKKIAEIVPPWWGVWIVAGHGNELCLDVSRQASRNPHVNPFAFAQLLWRDEALQALADYGLDIGMRSKAREYLWRRLASELTLEQLGEVVRTRLIEYRIIYRNFLGYSASNPVRRVSTSLRPVVMEFSEHFHLR